MSYIEVWLMIGLLNLNILSLKFNRLKRMDIVYLFFGPLAFPRVIKLALGKKKLL